MKKIFLLLLIVSLALFVFASCNDPGDVFIPSEGEGEGEGEVPDTNQLASIQIKVMNYEWWYDVYIDGNQSTGIWLGTTNWKGEATFNDISTGYHSFYIISVDIMYDGYKKQTIYPGNNTVEIGAYSTML